VTAGPRDEIVSGLSSWSSTLRGNGCLLGPVSRVHAWRSLSPGKEAQQLGFVTRLVDDPRAAALETAKEIANKSPDAIRAAKRLLNLAVASDAKAGLMAESVEQQKLIGSPNQLEAIAANLQKRAANFRD